MLMKALAPLLLLSVSAAFPLLGQSSDSVHALPVSKPDTLWNISAARVNAPHSHSFNIIPLSALFGSAGGIYEHLFGTRHGLLVEGSYAFGNGYEAAAGYRYHYYPEKDQHGLISPYWGFFIHKGNSTAAFEDPDTKLKYDLEIDILTIGAHWGERFAWGESFNYNWRIGYGFPVVLHLNWPRGKPGNYKTVEGLTKVFAGLDAELSVGILF